MRSKKSRSKKPIRFEIYRLKGSPAAFLGTVYAPDQERALMIAIKELNITNPEYQKRLLVRESA